jgi:hypothetical protein
MNVYSNLGFLDTLSNVASTNNIQLSPNQILFGIILFIFIIVILLFIWFKPKPDYVQLLGPIVLKGAGNDVLSEQKVVFTQSQIDTSLGNNFTLSLFVYMDDSNRERIPLGSPDGDFRFKNFITILGVGTITLDPIHQRARVLVRPLSSRGLSGNGEDAQIIVDNFMVARWNQLTITLEGRTLDVYVNGVLTKSTLLENLPILKPVMVTMETSPDFSGQAGLFQAWPRRLSLHDVSANYKRNTDTRGKPLIPDIKPTLGSIWNAMKKGFCDAGFCEFSIKIGGLDYVDYQYA